MTAPLIGNQVLSSAERKKWRRRIQFFNVKVIPLYRGVQRIVVTPERGEDHDVGVTYYFTVQDAEHLIGQLQRAIKRAPRAR